MAKNKLYFMIGLARSGKSTTSKKWLEGLVDFDEKGRITEYTNPQTRFNRVAVNADDWRLALGHRYNWFNEPVVHAHVKLAVRALLHKHNVLVDETNTTRSSILQWLEEDINAVPVLVDTDIETCKARAISTGQLDLLPVIDRMAANLQKTFGELSVTRVNEIVDEIRNGDARYNLSRQRIV